MSKPTIRIPNLKFNGKLTPINKNRVTKIVQHHMAHPSWDIYQIHDYHKNSRGWSGIGYNYWIAFDGTIYQGRGMNVGAHVTGHNSTTIGVGYQGDFTKQKMTDAQVKAGAELIKWLITQLPNVRGIQDVIGHRDLASTVCPGQNFRMDELKKLIGSTSPSSTTNKSYLKLGDKGQQVKELQEKLLKAGYKLPKYGADGDYGQETVNAVKELQKKHGLVVDGIFGEQSKKALEKELSQLKENLTVSQAKELQKQIDELKMENQRLRKLIETKLDKPNTANIPSNWAKNVWERITNIGYLDETRPQDYVKREELSQVLERLIDRNKLK